MDVREICHIIVNKHPYSESLNKKLMEDAKRANYDMAYKTNVKAKMSSYQTPLTRNIQSIKDWVNSLITNYYWHNAHGYSLDFNELWFAKYGKGDHTVDHHHNLSWLSFVYFINCPKGSSPLIFTTSGKKIKAEEGKVVIFPSMVQHYVPKNKCDERVVLAGNLMTPENGLRPK